MKTLTLRTALALATLGLFGCSEPEPQTTTAVRTTTVRTTETKVINLKIGMKGTDAVAQAGSPCSADTLKSIDAGENVTLKYQGRAYVFSKGVLQAVQ